MADFKTKYGTIGQPITVTLTSLADGGLRQATAVDNETDLYIDALVGGKIKTGSTVGSNGYVAVYASGLVDNSPMYGGDASGTDSAYTGKAENLRFLGVIKANGNGTTYAFGPWSVAAAFDGLLPPKWTLVFENKTGAALSASGSDHLVEYQGIHEQSV
jgi:hypothetical protein